MKKVKEFSTNQCEVEIYDTEYQADFCKIYMIKSIHRKRGKVNIRFGTKSQIDSIVKTYRKETRFKL